MSKDLHHCCKPEATSTSPAGVDSRRAGLWAASASVASALVASACCWLPLLLVTLGLSAAGVASAFEKVRPYFLGVCAVLLGLGFYLVYFRKERCALGTACATPNRRLTPFNQAMLWVAGFLVTVFALFPKWAGVALSFAPSPQADLASPGLSTMSLRIDGMTCESCALTAQRAILAVPGVREAKVLYTEREARITLDRTSPASTDALLAAVQKAGYEARIASDATDLPSLP